MLKRQIFPLFMVLGLMFLGCGESSSSNATENADSKIESSSEKTATSDAENILGTWRHEEDGGKSFEEWTFSKEAFTHEGGGSMAFKEKGTYSMENLDMKTRSITLALSDIQGNMGTDDRTIIISLGANKAEVSVNNLSFKQVEKK